MLVSILCDSFAHTCAFVCALALPQHTQTHTAHTDTHRHTQTHTHTHTHRHTQSLQEQPLGSPLSAIISYQEHSLREPLFSFLLLFFVIAYFMLCVNKSNVTVAILAQGTSWAVAVTQAFCAPGFKLSMACGLQLLCYKQAFIKKAGVVPLI